MTGTPLTVVDLDLETRLSPCITVSLPQWSFGADLLVDFDFRSRVADQAEAVSGSVDVIFGIWNLDGFQASNDRWKSFRVMPIATTCF